MKEIVLSLVLVVGIAVGAAYALEALDWSAASTYTTKQGNVRI
jgi:hypothetical protein